MARWVRVLEAFAEQGEWGVRDLPAPAASRAARRTGSSTTWPASVSCPGRMSRAASASDRTWPGSAARSPNTSTSGRSRALSSRSAARLIGETVVLAVYDPHRAKFSAVDAVETNHPIRYLWESLRDWSDLHLGSSGKGILAFLPVAERDAIIDRLPDPIPGRVADHPGRPAPRP